MHFAVGESKSLPNRRLTGEPHLSFYCKRKNSDSVCEYGNEVKGVQMSKQN